MCLIVLAWRAHPDFPLVVAANRDEFHARPADPAAFWTDHPGILAGRDLEARGTWMGVSRGGRFAAVTNYRGAREPRAIESRGALVTRFSAGVFFSGDFMKKINGRPIQRLQSPRRRRQGSCGGCRIATARRASSEPGVYGLGNLLLESPEVEPAKERFRSAIDPAPAVEPLFSVLAASKILNPEYGTRCSTVMLRASDGAIRYAERTFDAAGADGETRQFEFR